MHLWQLAIGYWQLAIGNWQLAISYLQLAKKDFLPDFTLGISYTQRDDLSNGMTMHDFFSAEISLNIPLFFLKKQSKKVDEHKLNLISTNQKFYAVKNEVLFQIENAFSELKKNEELIKLYKTGILPQASQSLNSAMVGYQVDKVDFLTLLNNQITMINFELEYYRLISEHEKNYAELEAAVGKRLIQKGL